MLQPTIATKPRHPVPGSLRSTLGSSFASLWNWSKLQTPPSPRIWLPWYIGALLIHGALALPVLLSFRGFAFLDGGSGLTADHLVSRGLLPAVDFGYYHGLLPLMIGRLWFSLLGETPYAYVGLRAIIAILSLVLFFYLFRAVRAPRVIYVLSCAAIPFVFFFRPSMNHDLAALAIILSLLLLIRQRNAAAASAALVSAFCHPSLGYVMLAAVGITALVSDHRASLPRMWRTVSSIAASALITLAAYFTLCAIFFHSPAPFLKTIFPVGGSGVRARYHWSFWNGGLTFLHPPGSNWKYLAGTNAGPYALFNLILLAGALITLAFIWRKRRLERGPILVLFACCLAVHAIYVIFVFGVPETWAYDAYLLILGLAALPFTRTRHLLALVMTPALLVGCYSSWSAARALYAQPREGGLWIDQRLAAGFARIHQLQPRGKPYVWSMSGGLSLLDDRFESPMRWFVVPGANPPSELTRLKEELLARPIAFLSGSPDDPNYLFQNTDFQDLQTRFREVERLPDFTACVRQP